MQVCGVRRKGREVHGFTAITIPATPRAILTHQSGVDARALAARLQGRT